jgi:two-component system, chemotaxis family, chemotaxis protein CheY
MAKALVVDDSRAMRMILTRALNGNGIQDVVQCANGREALDRMLADGGSFQLAMVDWNMPEMTGFEFLQHVRARADWNCMRVVMVTTETEMDQTVRALEAGADEYVMKPFTPEVIADKLRLLGVPQ